jgi:non-canonical poly(A) RNA polymerase PAPD5/7
VYTGGIGSYALLFLILSFLRLHPKVQSKEIIPRRNLGVLLIEFFELYGNHFNSRDLGICVQENRSYYFKKTAKGFDQPSRPETLCIIDPEDSCINDLIQQMTYQKEVITRDW